MKDGLTVTEVREQIKEYYETKADMLCTEKILTTLTDVILNLSDSNTEILSDEKFVIRFLEKQETQNYVLQKQPNMFPISDSVVANVRAYIEKHLPDIDLLKIYRSSNHKEDAHLYEIVGKNKNGTYSCWTCWNDEKCSLNFGHYGLTSEEEALKIMKEYFNDITGEPEKYGFEKSMLVIREEKKAKETPVIPFRHKRGR